MISRLLCDARGQLGWQGMYGIALLALAAAFHMLSIGPLERQESVMHNRIESARAKVGHGFAAFTQGDRQTELDAFYKSLPDEKDITDIMRAIYGTAEAYDVQLQEASYRMESSDAPRIEYVMNFPMSGEYARIRLFVSHILASHPYLALDQIDFRREHISDAKLKANVKMTLFLRSSR